MRIILTSVFVSDQDEALRFYNGDSRLCEEA